MKRTISIFLLISLFFNLFAQEKETYLYATKDTSKLYMDVYVPKVQNEQQGCLFFVFGGGFVGGKRDDNQVQKVKDYYTDKGYVVIAIDYRLGMRGQSNYSALIALKKFESAIYMAAEDLISALDYTLKNLTDTKKYKINPKNILVMGSSAGAITALQADYAMCNGYLNSNILPANFRLAGVISYAGAIFSTHGKPKYKNSAPAPTLFCHGTKDHLVNYKKTQIANIGFFGSDAIAKQFKKNSYSYHIRRYPGLGHQVAGIYNNEFALIDQFINEQVFSNNCIQIDETYYNASIEPKWMKLRVRDLKKVEQ
ncbi:MAG: carboxylesterase family protein [Bacteroidales bacterium]|nr:carboxylesterase family protein [Bacteroidales bacterium]